ncbi:MAG TPA: alpha/beta fold hydrolase [Trichormus sp.]
MNQRSKRIIFIISLVVNVAGVIFFAFYLNTLGHLSSVSMERKQLATTLAYTQTANVVSELSALGKVDKRAFISHFDGNEDVFAVEPIAIPAKTRAVTLFVFFHGMGASCAEPFEKPKNTPLASMILAKDHSYVVLAPNYRAPAGWASDAVISDVTQNIRLLCQQYPVEHIYLIGGSMGGCVSLIYAALAPDDIKSKLDGVVSIEGAGDLAELYHKSTENGVRVALDQSFGGSPERVSMAYAAKKFLYGPNISAVPLRTRFALVSAKQDKIVPPEFQDALYKALTEQGRPVTILREDMGHGWPPITTVMNAVDFVLKQPPPPKKTAK